MLVLHNFSRFSISLKCVQVFLFGWLVGWFVCMFFLLANIRITLFSKTNSSEILKDQLFSTFHLEVFLYLGKVILDAGLDTVQRFR